MNVEINLLHLFSTLQVSKQMGSNDIDLFRVSPSKAGIFLFLFTVSFIFTVTLFVINLYKSYKIANRQINLLQKTSTSLKRESWKPDLLLEIGIPLAPPSKIN